MSVISRPRAVSGRVFANGGDPTKNMLVEVKSAFDDFKTNTVKNFQTAIDDINAKISAQGMGGGGIIENASPDPEYSRLYAGFMRHGNNENELREANASGQRSQIQAAMSAGSGGDGGYLAPTEWDRKVNKALAVISPMRRISNVVPTGVRAYSTLWNTAAWGSGWVGETASRPQTSTATLAPVTFDNGEIYAMPAVTQQLLDDAQFNIEDWLSSEVDDVFAKQEGIAFIAGDGVNKPRGLLTYVDGGASDGRHPGGNLVVVPMGSAAAIQSDSLITFTYSLPAPYRQGASWLMNSTTAAYIRVLKDGQGNYIWKDNFLSGQPSLLLGYPVEIDENMPNAAAGSMPIAFGNFKLGYTVNDRHGIRILRDPYTAKPYVLFYVTKRVGGGVSDPNAIRLLKMAV